MEVCRELDLVGSFSHGSDPPITLEVRDQIAEVYYFLSHSLPAKSTSGGSYGDQPVSPISEELSLSIGSAAELPWRSGYGDQHEVTLTTFPFRDSWGLKQTRSHPLRPRKNNHHPKPPIRVSKRSRSIEVELVRNEELLLEEIAASGFLMLADQNPWKITKKLMDSDLNNQSRLLVSKALVDAELIPHLDEQCRNEIRSVDGFRVRVRDCDTNQDFQLKLKWWSSSRSYVFVGGWRKNFAKRRHLNTGDKIGLFWSCTDNMFIFSVLQRAELDLC